MLRPSALALALLGALWAQQPTQQAPPTEASWTWVVGALEDPAAQHDYATVARDMFAYFQRLDIYPGVLVSERELDALPPGPTVFLGPLEAFEHQGWLSPPLASTGSAREFLLGERLVSSARTGLYLRDPSGQHVVYTGLSLTGFQDIFSVPTGRFACTVTVDGRVHFEGAYADGELALSPRPFLQPLPTQAELADLPVDALDVAPIYADASATQLAPEFRARVSTLAHEQRVLFVGESHWNTAVNGLFNQLLAVLLETERVHTVFLEVNYSFSAHYDHYVTLADDAEARDFLDRGLHALISAPARLALLDLVRVWNREHPDAAVRVACIDMEWGPHNTIEHVLRPFFAATAPEVSLPDADALNAAGLQELDTRLRSALGRLRGSDAASAHPFLTVDFVERVLTNLADTQAIEDFHPDRQRSLVRNITAFHAEHFETEGLAIFKSGGFHAIKAKRADESFYREAAYLELVYEPTRGRVRTLFLGGIGTGFADVAGLDLATHIPSARVYTELVRSFQQALAEGRASEDGFYLQAPRPPTLLERHVLRTAYALDSNALWVRAIDPQVRQGLAAGAPLLLDEYDLVVYILRGQLESTRPKILGPAWIDVPGFVVEELQLGEGLWMAEDGFRFGEERVRVELKSAEADALEFLVTTENGLFGTNVFFRITPTNAEQVAVQTKYGWHTDVGPPFRGTAADVHGVVLLESRKAEDDKPLKLSFRLHLNQMFGEQVRPVLMEGEAELAVADLAWAPGIGRPGVPVEVDSMPLEELREVSAKWSTGNPRSHGWLDSAGRRHGVWSTWYADGTKQVQAEFVRGEREGQWASFPRSRNPYEAGQFLHGLRSGVWTEHRPLTKQSITTSGSYVGGKKEGEWNGRWADGSLSSKGLYKGGLPDGHWTQWFPNGNKGSEGQYEKGSPTGEWTLWNEDGTIKSVKTRRTFPWTPK